ncbi:hypothetical protein N9043_01210 [bacterium]|nr:hypothetical protein [bacterium]
MVEAFPILAQSGDQVIDLSRSKVRVRNCLSKQNIVCWKDILSWEIQDVQQIPSFGSDSFRELLKIAAEDSLRLSQARIQPDQVGGDHETKSLPPRNSQTLLTVLTQSFPVIDSQSWGSVSGTARQINESQLNPRLIRFIASHILNAAKTLLFSEAFPTLSLAASEPIARRQISVRLANILRSANINSWIDIRDFRLGEIDQLQGLGATTLLELIMFAVEDSLRIALTNPSYWAESSSALFKPENKVNPSNTDLLRNCLLDFVSEGAAWAVEENITEDTRELFEILQSSDVPSCLSRKRNQIFKSSPRDLYTEQQAFDLNESLEHLMNCLNERAQSIVLARMAISDRPTLVELAEKHKVTRERIRQIESNSIEKIEKMLEANEFRKLAWRTHSTKRRLGLGVKWKSSLCDRILNELCTGFENHEQAIKLLLYLAGPYKIHSDGWLRKEKLPDLESLRNLIDDNGQVESDALLIALVKSGLKPEMLNTWLVDSQIFRNILGHLYVWPKTLPDKIAVVFNAFGKPLSPEELVINLADDYSQSSVRNCLATDQRFIRVGLINYGLATWDNEEYSGIATEIEERILAANGKVNIEELEAELVTTFNLKKTSIRSQLNAPRFVVENNFVRLRDSSEEFEFVAEPCEVEGVYLLDEDRLNWRFKITKDHVRGSNFHFPKGLAKWIGLVPGKEIPLNSNLGLTSCGWSMSSAAGAYFRSIRAIVQSINLSEADEVLFTIDRRKREIEVSVIENCNGETVEEKIQSQTGLPILGCDMEVIAERLSYALNCDKNEIHKKLKARGENKLAELIPFGISVGPLSTQEARTNSGFDPSIDDLMRWTD